MLRCAVNCSPPFCVASIHRDSDSGSRHFPLRDFSMSFAGASLSGALDHPLFSDSLSAAQHGEFSNAFKGIAALIDDEEQEASSSPRKPRSLRPTSVPLCPTLEFAQSLPSMHNVLAASSGSSTPIVWTRPSAIRMAKQRASVQLQMMSSARKPRPTPYDRATSATAAAADTVATSAGASASPASPSGPSVAPASDYKPVRHERRRGFKPASSAVASTAAARASSLSLSDGLLPLTPRRSRSGGSPSDGSGGGGAMNDENEVESRTAHSLELADTHSSGEATMLLRMWKM